MSQRRTKSVSQGARYCQPIYGLLRVMEASRPGKRMDIADIANLDIMCKMSRKTRQGRTV